MKLHTLKILPKYYVALVNGEKTFELLLSKGLISKLKDFKENKEVE